MKLQDKESLKKWEQLSKDVRRSTTLPKETPAEKKKRIAHLEANHELWFEYYFPNYYTSRPAKFHIEASKRIVKNKRWYEVRAWSRELAKSTRTMMEIIFLSMTRQVHNVLLVSNSHDNAIRLLNPYRIQFEENKRLFNDYGKQITPGNWEADDFKILNGVSFRAIGALESPRGSLNENFRPDTIIVDDFDTDKECRNPDIIKNKWMWIEQALIPTLSISGDRRIIFNGNIIAKDCCVTRAIKMADHVDIINIRDKNGKSSWPEKNSEKAIDESLKAISWASQQKEYYNNPVTEGTIFKDIAWGDCPKLSSLKFVVIYGDPAPSNKENKANSTKSVFMVGRAENKYYIYAGYLDHVTNQRFVEWYYELNKRVPQNCQAYNYIENNSLQDPFYEQVFLPLFRDAKKTFGYYVSVNPDVRKKPDKFARIEGNLEPLNRNAQLIFNVAEKDNPNMIRLADQFKAVDPQLSAPSDGPDCIEGAVYIINMKHGATAEGAVKVQKRNPANNKNRY